MATDRKKNLTHPPVAKLPHFKSLEERPNLEQQPGGQD